MKINKIHIIIVCCLAFVGCENIKNISQDKLQIDSIDYYSMKYYKSPKIDFINKISDLTYSIKNDSIKLIYLDSLIKKLYFVNDSLRLKKNILSSIDVSTKLKDTTNLINNNIYLGYYYLEINRFNKAYYYFDNAEKLMFSSQNNNNISKIRLKKAQIQYTKGDYLGSEASIFKILPYYKKNNDLFNLNICYTLLGLTKLEIREFEDAYYFLNLSLDYAKKSLNKNSSIEIAYSNLGFAYFLDKNYLEAIKYFEKSISKDLKKNNFESYIFTKQYLIFSKFKLGYENNFENEYNEILRNLNSLNLSTVKPKLDLSIYYQEKENLKKAKEFALDAYNTSINNNTFRDKLLALKQLSEVFPEKYKYYTDEYVKLKDSIADVDKKTSNTFARIEYRVDELSNENIQLERKNKNIILYSLITGILGLMIYFYNWRKAKLREMILIQSQKQANEKIYSLMLDQQNQMNQAKKDEQKRISQELHDGVLGKLFGARMNLDFLATKGMNFYANKKDQFIEEIKVVEHQIRQLSHQISDEQQAIIDNFQMMINNFISQEEEILNLEIAYQMNGKVPWDIFSADEKINIYRIIQESFQNITKYAKAKNITFELNYINEILDIKIMDDGIGFKSTKKSNGIGIKNMKERAISINAIYTIHSEINKGTTTTLTINKTKDQNKPN